MQEYLSISLIVQVQSSKTPEEKRSSQIVTGVSSKHEDLLNSTLKFFAAVKFTKAVYCTVH